MGAKVKILLISHVPRGFIQFSSGLLLMRELRNRGYEVAAGGTYEKMEVDIIHREGFEFFDFFISSKISPVDDLKAILKLKNILKVQGFHISHSQCAKAGVINRVAGRLAKTPIVLQTVHAWPFHDFCPFPQKQIYKLIEKFAARLDDGIIVDSKEVKRRGITANICAPDHLHQIYMGVDIEKFRPFDLIKRQELRNKFNCWKDEYVIGCAARLVHGKGHDVLISAFSKLLKKHPNSRCLIAGDGELEESLRMQIKQEGIEEKCILLGRIINMPEFYNAIDVFCLPTHREGFGVANAEAMACGTPVVTTNVPPLDETVIDGVTGFLKPIDDVDAFASALIELTDEAKRMEFSRAGTENIKENFSSGSVNAQIIALYEKLLREKMKAEQY